MTVSIIQFSCLAQHSGEVRGGVVTYAKAQGTKPLLSLSRRGETCSRGSGVAKTSLGLWGPSQMFGMGPLELPLSGGGWISSQSM